MMIHNRHMIVIRVTDSEVERDSAWQGVNPRVGATLAGVFHIEAIRYSPMLATTDILVSNGILAEVPEGSEPPAFCFKDALQHYHDLVMAKP
jgi:hypothetical protein